MTAEVDQKPDAGSSAEGSESTLRWMVLAVVLVAGVALVPRIIRPPHHELVGKPAPAFALPSLDTGAGSTKVAIADLKGKPVLLDFWATWCGPCQAQSPILESVSKRWKDRGLAVVGVDTNDSGFAASIWAKRHGITYPIVADEDGSLGRSYGVKNLPTIVLLAKDGTIKSVREGLTDASELDRLVQSEL